jgi:hypothetical protein
LRRKLKGFEKWPCIVSQELKSEIEYLARNRWRPGWAHSSFWPPTYSVKTYKPFGTPVGVTGTDQKWKYAGEMLDSSAVL